MIHYHRQFKAIPSMHSQNNFGNHSEGVGWGGRCGVDMETDITLSFIKSTAYKIAMEVA